MQRPQTLLLLSFGCMLAGACAKSNPDTTTPEPTQSTTPTPPPADPTPATAPAVDPPTGDPNPSDAPDATPAPPKLTDAEIAAIVKAANDGEIEQAKLAKSKARDKAVKDFAAMMAKDHAAMNKKTDALARKANLEPKENELSARITDEARVAIDKLKTTAKGAEFDRAYIDAQVNAHTQVLDTIDKLLLPNVQNPDLKVELESTRPKVEAHLGQAREIQAKLAPPTV